MRGGNKMKQNTLLLAGLLIVSVFLAGCTTAINKEKSTTQTTGALLSAPDFSATTTAGDSVSLAKYLENGKPTLLYFMASWCPTCAKNWPDLEALHKSGDANILAISIDPTDTAEVLNELAAEKGLTFPMVPGNTKIMLDFGVTMQTTSIGIDSQGNIGFTESGDLSLEKYRSLINELN